MRELFLILSTVLFSTALSAQYDDIIELRNPSFEGIPHKGTPGDKNIGIRGWYDCGELHFRNESPVDLHPSDTASWQVELGPSKGNTYLGMVVRDNDSWESVSQRLPAPLESGKCYSFSIDMSRSPYYVSLSRETERVENYTEPAVLRIWGGSGVCGHQELIAESDVVDNNEWKTFDFEIQPSRDLNYVTLEAFYEVPILFPYNGHILLDNASAFEQIPCPGDQLLATETSKPKERSKPKPTADQPIEITSQSNPVIVAQVDNSSRQKKKLLEDLDGKKVKKGQIIRIENLYFQADSYVIEENSDEVLSEVYDFLKGNRNILIEIGGHTNTVPDTRMCDQLSTNRAKEVALYLSRKGISPKRMKIRGYGKRKPIIANDKYDMEARKKNQRVEIKILSLNYTEATG